MKKSALNTKDKKHSSKSKNRMDDVYISDENQHLNSVVAAHDMLAFLRSTTHNLADHDEAQTPSFYRGLSLCLAAVQEQLEQGLSKMEDT